MKAPKRESAGHDQEHNGENAPRNTAIASGFFLFLASGTRSARAARTGASSCGGGSGRAGFGGRHEVGNGLVFVHAQMAGVGANKAFVEDAAGKLIEAVFLNGGEETGADLGGHSNVVQRDLALFPLPLQSCPKGFHLAVFPPPQLALAASKM